MLVTDRRAVRTAARLLVVPMAVTALAVAAPPAAAHTELDSASPAAGATLAGLPPRLSLTFSDPMAQKYAKVAVTGPDGASVAVGGPRADGGTVTLALDAGAPSGRYTVGYRVVSEDGHPVSGSYSFTVRATAASSAGSPAPSRAAEAQEGPGESSGTRAPLLAGAGVLAAAGIAAGLYARRRRQARRGD
ncbi:copper resistance CopC family protein [Streptomyces sp. NPDC051773]|uniref:copper resistance CopC family protein n=1 Tax=Streptomyces sp. NPDC051773 TaxID=3156682 RepID=UPI003415A65C